MRRTPLARFAWTVLVLNLGVILWGAYVRASGSGAGCGRHWPLCDGEVIPRAPSAEKLVEFTHRATSGLAFLAVLALVVAVFRSRPRGHGARRAAAWAMAFMVLEAGVGAALVLLELVADDASMGRAVILGVHLVNTFLLLAALALVARRSEAPPDLPEPARDPATPRRLGLAALALLVVSGASGAIAALGDTLFPSGTLAEALAQDVSETAHLLIRLRIGHPILAASAAIAVLLFVARRRMAAPGRPAPWATGAAALAVLQCLVGLANVALLAPIALQLVHLLIADLLWIATVLAVDD